MTSGIWAYPFGSGFPGLHFVPVPSGRLRLDSSQRHRLKNMFPLLSIHSPRYIRDVYSKTFSDLAQRHR